MVETAERYTSTYAYATHMYSGAIIDVPVFSWTSSISSTEPPSTTKTIGFLTRDPIGYEGSEWGLYEYGLSSPIEFSDPTGECAIKDCCCCAEDVVIRNVKPINSNTHWGHSFEFAVSLSYVESQLRIGGSFKEDCTFDWYETSSLPPKGTRLRPNVEEDMKKYDPKSATWDPWVTKRNKPCPGADNFPFKDSPTLAKEEKDPKTGVVTKRTAKRDLTIRIVITSAPGCKCSKPSVTATAKQTLSLVNGVGKDQIFK